MNEDVRGAVVAGLAGVTDAGRTFAGWLADTDPDPRRQLMPEPAKVCSLDVDDVREPSLAVAVESRVWRDDAD